MALWWLALALIVHACGSSGDFYSIVYEESSIIAPGRTGIGGMFWLRNNWNASLGIPEKFPITKDDASSYMLSPGQSARYICTGTGEWVLLA